jgi:hypothetical protein
MVFAGGSEHPVDRMIKPEILIIPIVTISDDLIM